MDFDKWVASQKKVMTNFKLKGKTVAVSNFLFMMAETEENFITSYGGDVPFEIEELDYLDFQRSIGYPELPYYLFRQFNNKETRTALVN